MTRPVQHLTDAENAALQEEQGGHRALYFTLDNGIIVGAAYAQRRVVAALGKWSFTLQERREAARWVISPEAGRCGCLVSALVADARTWLVDRRYGWGQS